jgi:rubrerythrin
MDSDTSPNGSPRYSIDFNPPNPSGSERTQRSSEQLLGIGIAMIVMSIVFGSLGIGCTVPVFAFIGGVICIVLFFIVRGKEEEEAEVRADAAQEAEKRFKDEIADAVKERMKGTIKVRCRYCGSLNDEEAHRCDSCGATL